MVIASSTTKERKEILLKQSEKPIIHKGERVLVRKLAFEGSNKLKAKCEEDPDVASDQPNFGIPVNVVRKENGPGKKQSLSRNKLLIRSMNEKLT